MRDWALVPCLLGLAEGDRNGGPTQLALRLTKSLQACSQDVGRRFLEWWVEGADHGGGSFPSSLWDILLGRQQKGSRGDGRNVCWMQPCTQAGSIGFAFGLSRDKLVDLAKQEAALTHWHPLAGDVPYATSSWPAPLAVARFVY